MRERPRNTSDDNAGERERAKKGDEKESKTLKRTARWTEWEMDRERGGGNPLRSRVGPPRGTPPPSQGVTDMDLCCRSS